MAIIIAALGVSFFFFLPYLIAIYFIRLAVIYLLTFVIIFIIYVLIQKTIIIKPLQKMKKTILFSGVVITFLSAFTIINDPAKDILGKWKLDDSSVPKATKAIIEQARKTNAEMAQQMEENYPDMENMVSSLRFEYKEDNSYVVETPQGPQASTYKLVDNNRSIQITRSNGTTRKDSILELSATRLRLINKERNDTSLYVRP